MSLSEVTVCITFLTSFFCYHISFDPQGPTLSHPLSFSDSPHPSTPSQLHNNNEKYIIESLQNAIPNNVRVITRKSRESALVVCNHFAVDILGIRLGSLISLWLSWNQICFQLLCWTIFKLASQHPSRKKN